MQSGFTVSVDLNGLPPDNPSTGTLKTDGVVISYRQFGTIEPLEELSYPFRLGHSLTHEIGHFLGLFHPWGDIAYGCGGDDFCNGKYKCSLPFSLIWIFFFLDTPQQRGSFFGWTDCVVPNDDYYKCELQLPLLTTFMGYNADPCRYMFTDCQVQRMRTVLENSPRRTGMFSIDIHPPRSHFLITSS